MVTCLERGADLHMAQLMPLPLTDWFTFLVPANPGSPGKRAVKRVCVCVCFIPYVYASQKSQLTLEFGTRFQTPKDPIHTRTHTFNRPSSWATRVSRYQKGKTNLDFIEARDSVWQWHQLGHMQVCTLLQTDNHASTPPLSFLQAGCPSCRPTNSVKVLKGKRTP